MARKLPGYRWRVLGWKRKGRYLKDGYATDDAEVTLKFEPKDRVEFDELVVDDWFHIEQMDDRDWWARIGDAYIWIHIASNGKVQVDIRRGEYGPACGTTEADD